MTNHDNGTHTATVEALTATVTVMKVGSRQVTMSVFNQLDWVEPEEITVFGRVCPRTQDGYWPMIHVVGADPDGALVRSRSRATLDGVTTLLLDQLPNVEYSATEYPCGRSKAYGELRHCPCQECTGVPADHLVRKYRALKVDGIHPGGVSSLVEWEEEWAERLDTKARIAAWTPLPLIVLAGLR